MKNPLLLSVGLLLIWWGRSASGQDEVMYQQVAPVFTKYCAGCHNATDREGDFSLATFEELIQGTASGSVAISGQPEKSRLWQLMAGLAEPQMPPEGEPRPTDEELELVRSWISDGLQRHATNTTLASRFSAPQLPPAELHHQYVGAACAVEHGVVLGKHKRIEMFEVRSTGHAAENLLGNVQWSLGGLAGKVNSLRRSPDGRWLVAGSGIAGIGGEILLIDVTSGAVVQRFQGHSDAVYCAAVSPDGTWLASGSYDRQVLVWDVETGTQRLALSGHNGAIYDLDFDPTSRVLATASADQTVKLWHLPSGQRLDTLGQPEGEMLCVRFDQSGQNVYAGGADKQIRKWRLASRDSPAINPMLLAKYAHESAVLRLATLPGGLLLSASEDRTVKLWKAEKLTSLGQVAELNDTPVALATMSSGTTLEETNRELVDSLTALTVELTGKLHLIRRSSIDELAAAHARNRSTEANSAETSVASVADTDTDTAVLDSAASQPVESTEERQKIEEVEPNDVLTDAMRIELPAEVSGRISPEQKNDLPDAGNWDVAEDVDLIRFETRAGESWIFEIHAASQQSPLDSRIDVLDASGQPVLRTRLQALRASYFTFRGKDSDTSDDFRLHKWQDMELDEFLYAGGEVNRLWLYPRGPDSGFKVYPGFGKRYSYFGTTPVAHALGEPAYIVRELAADEEPLPNGLPVFPIYFENDDDPLRRASRDSRLHFVAPETGTYFLRVRDARSFGGQDFRYVLTIRRPQPDFSLQVTSPKLAMPRGSGREWQVTATRHDGLNGPISITLSGLPEGFVATNPVIIEAEQDTATGTIFATEQAAMPGADVQIDAAAEGDNGSPTDSPVKIQLTAQAEQNGRRITRQLEQHLELSLVEQEEVQIRLESADNSGQALRELFIRPGETVSAKVVVERNGTTSRIGFGKDDSGRNLPHGAFVDNIGLNGLLITEGNSSREFFITAAPKVRPGRRQFHLRSETKGNPTSRPIWLHVLPEQPEAE